MDTKEIELEKIRRVYWKSIDIFDAIYEEYYNRMRAKGRWKGLKKYVDPVKNGSIITLDSAKLVLEKAEKWVNRMKYD